MAKAIKSEVITDYKIDLQLNKAEAEMIAALLFRTASLDGYAPVSVVHEALSNCGVNPRAFDVRNIHSEKIDYIGLVSRDRAGCG